MPQGEGTVIWRHDYFCTVLDHTAQVVKVAVVVHRDGFVIGTSGYGASGSAGD
jgi:hypothetical protein